MIKKGTLFIIISIISVSMYGCSNKQATADKQATVEKQATAEKQVIAEKQATTEKQSTIKKQVTTSPNNKTSNKTTASKESKNKTVVKESFYGEWIIKSNPVGSSVTAYSSEDVKNIVGKKVTYSKAKASYGTNICTNPVYKKSSISKSEFESSFRVNFSKLNVASFPLKHVVVDGLSGIGNHFYVKDANTLLLFSGGYFFELDRLN
ncbi:hypothetical protein LL033_00480 [Clostridium estertheticum]|uniref:hypothetical protein n=1 Tax=Clostridium estertheticum TaxID=238834 RepID=UPI001C0B615C|nr:hypothetical protein [Clostridium estertheticum]MBU3218076.1 hypothetical protein [Clostridium estertheticum]WAG55743.1 hypothetical protein LL033_00480 [Clostridium estertheticum]